MYNSISPVLNLPSGQRGKRAKIKRGRNFPCIQYTCVNRVKLFINIQQILLNSKFRWYKLTLSNSYLNFKSGDHFLGSFIFSRSFLGASRFLDSVSESSSLDLAHSEHCLKRKIEGPLKRRNRSKCLNLYTTVFSEYEPAGQTDRQTEITKSSLCCIGNTKDM